MAAGIQSKVPLGRFGNPEETAAAALFLASDDSAYLLGAEIVVDGGLSNSENPRVRCPACAGPTGCRLETGEAHEGTCWCKVVTVSDHAFRRLRDDPLEPQCLCCGGLADLAARPEASWQELSALGRMPLGVTREEAASEESPFDADGALSRAFLLARGSCCQNGCKNCPYGFDDGRCPRPIPVDEAPSVGKSDAIIPERSP